MKNKEHIDFYNMPCELLSIELRNDLGLINEKDLLNLKDSAEIISYLDKVLNFDEWNKQFPQFPLSRLKPQLKQN